ncbi:hypothetical protein CFC21_044985 [Triticum aestivum]|uniref:Calmodulin binding protein-like N-terminal domain-containing protein n=1 Tax=Triticum aestivum TaxID=4565 RepID=A0A9R1FRM0_WHEAT|nr:hypothetical protein CFC21_044985 [Triticum aestivum]
MEPTCRGESWLPVTSLGSWAKASEGSHDPRTEQARNLAYKSAEEQLRLWRGGSMGKKRKQDPGRDDSSSSDAKRCRFCHCQNGETSRPNDGMPPREGLVDIVRAVIELKEVMQVKLSTEEKFKSKIKKLKEKRKKDKKQHEEDLRVLKADLRKLKKNQKELKFQIQEMRKEECVEVNHYKASPSQRIVQTEDGGGHIKVVMYDGDDPIASDHDLASVELELVLIEGAFDKNRDSWSKEEFKESIIQPQKTTGLTSLVKNGTFDLSDGKRDYKGAIIMDNSKKKEVKLGVRIAGHTKIRVLEGVSNPFKVQEGKTESCPDGQHSLPPPVIQGVLEKTDDNRPAIVPLMVEENGHELNGNGQQPCQQITQIPCLQTSTHSMQHDPGYCGQDQYTCFLDSSPQFACPDLYAPLNEFCQWTSAPNEWRLPSQSVEEVFVEDVPNLYVRTQIQETCESYKIGQVLLQWDKPHVELKEQWNFLDQLMPLYSTQAVLYRESFPSTSLMEKAHKLMGSISSGDSVMKIITSLPSRTTQTPQRRGVLIRPIEPYDSDDEPPVKKQRNAKYQLRFVNRVCNDYYTREQIKSEDGNLLKVALYDENNLLVTSGPLSLASVEIVLLHGDFNAEGQDCWTPEEFTAFLVHPKSVQEPPALGGDRVLTLTDGEADLGNVYFQISSFHARTEKFKMGVEIKNVREVSVQEGITRPFHVRVRQGEESSRHRITSLEALLRVKIELPKQVECDARESTGGSSAMDDQSLQVRSILGASSKLEDHDNMVWMASDQSSASPLRDSVFPLDIFWSTFSDQPPERMRRELQLLSTEKNKDADYSTAMDQPPERFTRKRRELQLLSTEKNKDADYSTAMDGGVRTDPDSAAVPGGVWPSDPDSAAMHSVWPGCPPP